MSFISNIAGTISSTFRIGRRGISISQGNTVPPTGSNGDIFITKGTAPRVFQYRDGWVEIGGARSYTEVITGDNVKNAFDITHSLGTTNVIVTVIEDFGARREVMVSNSRLDTNTIRLLSDDPIPAGLSYIVRVTA